MRNSICRLLCPLLCIGLLCGCTAATESAESPPEPAKAKAVTKREQQVSVEVQWIETTAEIPPGDPELNGRLWDGPMPEGVDLRNRIYTNCYGIMDVIDLEGNLVHWGLSCEDFDTGWDYDNGRQPYAQRSVLMKNAQKMAPGYLASLVIDDNQDLWGWGSNPHLLMYDGDSNYPTREPIKMLSDVKDVAAGDFEAAVVRTDGRLQAWCRQEGWQKPVTIRTGVEKICSLFTLLHIDQQHCLYYYPDGWNSQQKPKLLDRNIDDVSMLLWNFFLERKTDGSVWIKHFNSKPVLLAEDSIQLAYNGYIAPDGTFWGCRKLEDAPGPTLIVQPMDSACSILGYGSSGDVHIMKDGEIRVCLNEEETEGGGPG